MTQPGPHGILDTAAVAARCATRDDGTEIGVSGARSLLGSEAGTVHVAVSGNGGPLSDADLRDIERYIAGNALPIGCRVVVEGVTEDELRGMPEAPRWMP